MPQPPPDYWQPFIERIAGFTFLAFLIERSLYQVFDTKLWQKFEKTLLEWHGLDYLDPKPWITVAVSITVVMQFNLDMIAAAFGIMQSQTLSLILTGLFVSGGSTGVYKFFKRTRELKDAAAEDKLRKLKGRNRVKQ